MNPAEPFPLPLSPANLAKSSAVNGPLAMSLVRLGELQAGLESERFRTEQWLTAAEQSRYDGYRFPKRRLEWLGGRLAAKHAAISLSAGSSPRHWQVDNRSDGSPCYLSAGVKNPLPHLSISHGHGLAAALASPGKRCGLDLQKITDTVLRVRTKFCREEEAKLLFSAELSSEDKEAAPLTMLWAAKEALRKGLGGQPLTGFLDMQLDHIEVIAGQGWVFAMKNRGDSGILPIIVCWLEDFAVAFGLIDN